MCGFINVLKVIEFLNLISSNEIQELNGKLTRGRWSLEALDFQYGLGLNLW